MYCQRKQFNFMSDRTSRNYLQRHLMFWWQPFRRACVVRLSVQKQRFLRLPVLEHTCFQVMVDWLACWNELQQEIKYTRFVFPLECHSGQLNWCPCPLTLLHGPRGCIRGKCCTAIKKLKKLMSRVWPKSTETFCCVRAKPWLECFPCYVERKKTSF